MSSLHVTFRRGSLALLAAATLALTPALLSPAPSAPTVLSIPRADAATGNNGFLLTTVPGSKPGDGSAEVKVTLPITDSIPVTAVINGGGTFDGGATSLPFNLKGMVGDTLFEHAYQCATAATTISVLDATGTAYTTVPAQFKAGTCGPPAPTVIAVPQPSVHVAACVNNAAVPGTVTVAATPNVTVNGVTGEFSASGYGPTTLTYQATGNYTFASGKTASATIDLGNKPDCTPVVVLKQVTPVVPTMDDQPGVANDTVGIPSVEGVIYTDKDGNILPAGVHHVTTGGPYTVLAKAADGYELTGLAHYMWPFVFSNVTDTPPAVVKVTAPPVTFNDDTHQYTIPSKDGVVYEVNGSIIKSGTYPGTGTVTVTAKATAPNTAIEGDSCWEHTFKSVVVTPPTVKPTPTPTPVVTPAPKPSSHPVTTPAPTKVAPQPVVVKTPTKKAVPVIKSQPTQSTTTKPRINGIVAYTATGETTPSDSFGWLGAVGVLIVLSLLFTPSLRRKDRRA